MTTPQPSRSTSMMATLIDIVSADTTVQGLFDLGVDGRRILKDDPSRISQHEQRLLAFTQIGERQTDASFDNPSDTERGSDEYRITIGVVVYVYKPKDSKGEAEKELLVDLTGAVRDAILSYQVGPNFQWFDIVHRGSEYDSADGFRRSDSVYVLRARARRR